MTSESVSYSEFVELKKLEMDLLEDLYAQALDELRSYRSINDKKKTDLFRSHIFDC